MANQDNNKTNLIVNYLPQTLTDEEFKSMFLSVGPIKSSKICRDKMNQYSYGFGFVEYVHEEDAVKAIQQLNKLPLQNKTIKVAYARPNNEDTKGANLYIRGLPKCMTKESLADAFSEFGSVVQVRVLTEQFSDLGKGIGFVLYENRRQAETAMTKMSGVMLPGGSETLKIKFVDDSSKKVRPHEFSNQAVGQNFGRGGGSSSFRGGPMRNQNPRMRFNPMGNGNGYSNQGGGNFGGGNFGGGGSYGGGGKYDGDDFEDDSFGSSNFGGSTGYGFYNESYDDEYEVGGYGSANNYGGFSGGRGRGNNFASTPRGSGRMFNAARSPRQANMTSEQTQDGHIVFVYNIGPDADEKMLWQLFCPYGMVQKVNVIRGNDNKGKGYGFATMVNYEEACAAINGLNGMKFHEGKPLQVSFKK